MTPRTPDSAGTSAAARLTDGLSGAAQHGSALGNPIGRALAKILAARPHTAHPTDIQTLATAAWKCVLVPASTYDGTRGPAGIACLLRPGSDRIDRDILLEHCAHWSIALGTWSSRDRAEAEAWKRRLITAADTVRGGLLSAAAWHHPTESIARQVSSLIRPAVIHTTGGGRGLTAETVLTNVSVNGTDGGQIALTGLRFGSSLYPVRSGIDIDRLPHGMHHTWAVADRSVWQLCHWIARGISEASRLHTMTRQAAEAALVSLMDQYDILAASWSGTGQGPWNRKHGPPDATDANPLSSLGPPPTQ